ncbi:MarR family winged helix-turn-helix transcriptional regulator [Gordonia aquimaris]|uniref:MarR family transcriptional regulator n=1 Tax=Gordonia aquimaris TaxID=2984863 RepID=A0A9X3I6D8_9ACTN|nr:MarR family transcriptional regulator [Gordonia aquimaris]MCX2966717.1 MarR family transcriptional regulator [Gordonia aquimaris]
MTLTPDEQRAFRGFLTLSMLLDDALDVQLRRDSGLTHSQYMILFRLSEAPEKTIGMRRLVVLAHSEQSRLSHAVTVMEGRGWVRRVKSSDGSDRRAVSVMLTEAGMDLVRAAAPRHSTEAQRLIFDALDADDLAHLNSVIDRVLPHMSALGLDLPSPQEDPTMWDGRVDPRAE